LWWALVDGVETTLKRIYREPDGRVRLQPANAFDEADLVWRVHRFAVQGKVLSGSAKILNRDPDPPQLIRNGLAHVDPLLTPALFLRVRSSGRGDP
jgi:hypothetical protein